MGFFRDEACSEVVGEYDYESSLINLRELGGRGLDLDAVGDIDYEDIDMYCNEPVG